MHRLKGLVVYRKALTLTRDVRTVTKNFPKDERFELPAQFKSAVDSIALNIAEGAGNTSSKEFKKFLTYSIRSGFECIGCLDIAPEKEFIPMDVHLKTMNSVNEVIAMVYGLQKRLV